VRFASDHIERSELLHEARLLYGLSPHKGLPLLRDDFFGHDGSYYAVLDWVEGQNLQQLLAREGRPGLDPRKALRALRDVAAALEHLHGHAPPVVHRDIKPANIVLGEEGLAVLVDFGVSSRGADGASGSTRGFAAPELVRSDQVTPAADVFSLAATAFALLTGAPPHVTGADAAIPGGRRGRRRAMSVLRRALSYDPARRPTSASALVVGLQRALDPRSVPPRAGRVRAIAVAASLVMATSIGVAVARSGNLVESQIVVRAEQLTAVVDQPVQLTGRLSVPRQRGPWNVEVRGLLAGGERVPSSTVTTTADGVFSHVVRPPRMGTVVFEVSWRGDRRSRPSRGSTPAIAVAGLPSRVSLSQRGTISSYGSPASLVVTKRPGRAGDVVKISLGGRALATGAIDGNGTFRFSTKVRAKSTFVATFAGTDRESPASSAALVVRAVHRVTLTLTGFRSRSGNELIFGPNDDLKVAIRIAPKVTVGCVNHRIEQLVGGTWKPDFVGSCTAARGLRGFTLGNGANVGVPHRIRVEYEQAKNDVDVSPWTYFRVP
jgi:hypothetical protein